MKQCDVIGIFGFDQLLLCLNGVSIETAKSLLNSDSHLISSTTLNTMVEHKFYSLWGPVWRGIHLHHAQQPLSDTATVPNKVVPLNPAGQAG